MFKVGSLRPLKTHTRQYDGTTVCRRLFFYGQPAMLRNQLPSYFCCHHMDRFFRHPRLIGADKKVASQSTMNCHELE